MIAAAPSSGFGGLTEDDSNRNLAVWMAIVGDARMKILCLYDAGQTFTNTIFEHLLAFSQHSQHALVFGHLDFQTPFAYDVSRFDAIIVHYSIRLPFDALSERTADKLGEYNGLKALFIQDEYDDPRRACYWMNRCKFDVVFTVVPEHSISEIYDAPALAGIKFVTSLTGYVPETLPSIVGLRPPSQRRVVVGYRGRNLPVRYGQLGFEKVSIGEQVKKYCDAQGIENDIAWTENKRIYGPKWYEFIANCRANLGSESGSNVFDWDNSVTKKIASFRRQNSGASDEEIYEAVVKEHEVPGLMNQLSPRIFESIALRSVLVLLEGRYSGVVKPDLHYVSLAKDYSNIADVFDRLADGAFCDGIADRAYADVIATGDYSYRSYVSTVDSILEQQFTAKGRARLPIGAALRREAISQLAADVSGVTVSPVRAAYPKYMVPTLWEVFNGANSARQIGLRLAFYCWGKLPDRVRAKLKPKLHRALEMTPLRLYR